MDIRDFIKSIPLDEIERKNISHIAETKAQYEDFKRAFLRECCSLCGNRLDYFNPSEPCLHWFLKPDGIGKKNFSEFLSEPIGYFKIESYFRWVASMESQFMNINDLTEEVSASKIKEITIKFKNIEWALSFGLSDLNGHSESKNANFPHFHLQMYVDELPFIVFNDFHIPFSNEDLFFFELQEKAGDLVDFRNDYGEGMSIIENPEKLKILDHTMKVALDESLATFHTSTMIKMPVGKTISMEKIEKIFSLSKDTCIPVRHLIAKEFPDATIVTQVSPGEGVPIMKKRVGRKKKNI